MNENSKKRAVIIKGNSVTLPLADYQRLLAKAAEHGEPPTPPLPARDSHGNFPAVAYMRASIARQLIDGRRAAGLTQMELAAAADVRQETISRIESGKHTVSETVMGKIERALNRAMNGKHRGAAGRKSKRSAHT